MQGMGISIDKGNVNSNVVKTDKTYGLLVARVITSYHHILFI